MTTDLDALLPVTRLDVSASAFSCDGDDGYVNISSWPSFSAGRRSVTSPSLVRTLSSAFPHPAPAGSHSQGCHESNKGCSE